MKIKATNNQKKIIDINSYYAKSDSFSNSKILNNSTMANSPNTARPIEKRQKPEVAVIQTAEKSDISIAVRLWKHLKKKWVLVLLLYVFLTCLFTYPVVFKLGSEVPKVGGDTYQMVGFMEFQTQVLREKGMIQGFVQLAKIHKINLFTPYAILSLALGRVLAYNIMYLASFILSGLGTYFLVMYLTKNPWASFFSGLIFAFAPFHVYHSWATHAGTMHQEWLPFFALFLFKFFEDIRLKNFLLAGFSFFLIAMTEHQLLAFTVLFSGFFLIYKLLSSPRTFLKWKLYLYIGLTGIILASAAFFFFAPLLKVALSEKNYLNAGVEQSERYANNLADPLAPAPFHSYFKNANSNFLNYFQGLTNIDTTGKGEKGSSAYIGYATVFGIVAIIIALLLSLFIKIDWIKERRSKIVFWLIILISFYVFSLGPSLDLESSFGDQHGGSKIQMPLHWVYEYLPFYENIRTTGRFFVYAMLAASVLGGMGLAFLTDRFRYPKYFVVIFFSSIIFVEFAAYPIPTTALSYSSIYDRIAQDSEEYKLLEIPGSTEYDYASFVIFTSAIHGKKAVNGMSLARIIPYQYESQKTTPVMRELLYELPEGREEIASTTGAIIHDNFFSKADDIFNYQNIRYIIIGKDFISKKDRLESLKSLVERSFKNFELFEDDQVLAYKLARKETFGFYATITDTTESWGDDSKEKITRLKFRPISSGAQFLVVNMEKKKKEIKVDFKARAIMPMRLSIRDAQKEIASWNLAYEWKDYSFSFSSHYGKNELQFAIFDNNGNEIRIDRASMEERGARIADIKLSESTE